jgi:purine-binding chemotaxis protein CheW
MTTETTSYCTFWLGDQRLGIEVLEVQEVLRTRSMSPVPLAGESIAGLINLRGQIITAIDLRRRLELPPREDDKNAVSIVVRTQEGPVSMLVDSIGGVLEVDGSTFETPPETVSGNVRKMISGVHKVDGPLLHVIDTERVIGDLVAMNKRGEA